MKTLASLSLLLFFISPVINAQSGFFTPGTVEFGGDISFTSKSADNGSGTATQFNSSLFVGFMLTPGFELGLRPGFSISSSSNSSYKLYNLYLNPAYNFNAQSTVDPYLGIILGYNSVVIDESNIGGLGIGAEAGLKIHIGATSLMLVRFEYLSQKYSGEDSQYIFGQDNDFKVSNASIGLGFRTYIEGKHAPKTK